MFQGSPPDEVPLAAAAGSVEFPGRVCIGRLDTHEHARSVLVVRHPESSRLGLPGAPSPGSSVFGPTLPILLGSQSHGPVYLRSLVSRLAQNVHQLARTSSDSHGAISFLRVPAGQVGGFVLRQHHGPHLPKEEGRHVLTAAEFRAQLLLRWTESMGITLLPQFIMGAKNVVANSLSHCHQVLGSEWTLAQEVVDDLRRI